MEGQLAVKEDVRDKLVPEKQESMIATASPISSTDYRKPPLFLDLRTCAVRLSPEFFSLKISHGGGLAYMA